MKRILLALTLLLFASAANAQCTGNAASTSVCGNTTGSTAPAGWTRTPAVISVRTPLVIGGTTASSTLTLESTSGVGTSDSILFKTGSQATRWTINTGGTLTGTPAAGTTNKGFSVTQTSPTSGSVAGPLYYNLIDVTHQLGVTGSGLTPQYSWNTESVAFRVNMTTGGTSVTGQNMSAGYFALADTIAGAVVGQDRIGLVGSAYSTNAGSFYGVVPFAAVDLIGAAQHLVALESDVGIASTATAQWRVGVRSVNTGINGTDKRAAQLDAAFAAANIGSSSGSFDKLIALQQGGGFTAPALATTGDFFYSDTAVTVANFANLGNVTCTANILKFPNAILACDGSGAFGGALSSTVANQFVYKVTSGGSTSLVSKTDTTSGYNGVSSISSTASVETDLVSYEASNTSTLYGQTLGNWSLLNSTSPNGMIIGLTTNKPMLFATNGSERMRLLAGLNVGDTTDPGAGIISALTGFRVNNAAASGNVLRGNGTNFVSSALAVGDLSGLGTGVATALGVNVGSAGAFVVNGGALGSPSSAGTIPAFTLGGTVAGGGNQINNVIIGTSTPLGGRFTTLLATTTAVLGTDLAPATNVILTVNGNAAAPVAATGGRVIAQMSGLDAVNPVVLVDGFGTNVTPLVVTRTGRGTAASFTATQSNDGLGFFGYVGAIAANTFPNSAGAAGGAYFGGRATENWSSTAQGAKIQFFTTPNTTAVVALAATLHQSGGFSVGSGTDPGIGVILAASGYSANGAAGLSVTKTVRASGGASDCTLIYTFGLLTGGTC